MNRGSAPAFPAFDARLLAAFVALALGACTGSDPGSGSGTGGSATGGSGNGAGAGPGTGGSTAGTTGGSVVGGGGSVIISSENHVTGPNIIPAASSFGRWSTVLAENTFGVPSARINERA